jgi:hypothetical protein
MEARLTEDILEVASNNNGMFIVHNETEDQRVIPCWEAVSKSSLKTPKEVYDGLEKDGYACVNAVPSCQLIDVDFSPLLPIAFNMRESLFPQRESFTNQVSICL